MQLSSNNSDLPIVAIFGGAGYIGSVLTRQLLELGYPVRVFDNFLFGDDGVKDLKHPNLEVISGDICDIKAISSACENAEVVILLAAIVGHRVRPMKWQTTRTINFLASSALLDTAKEHGVSRFIFACTDSVYGLQQGLIYETGTPEPVSLYSRLKLRMEERVIKAKTGGFHTTSLRVANCHGLSDRMRFDIIVNGLVRDAITKKQITLDSGEQVRSFIHVNDAAQAFISCVKAHENLISGEIFNVANSAQTVSLSYLANLVKSAIPETSVMMLDEIPDLVDYQLSCSKIEKLLDFTPKHTIQESIIEVRDALLAGRFPDPYSLRYHNT
jgi:nucleoside-diphosphate-sugar epimerase